MMLAPLKEIRKLFKNQKEKKNNNKNLKIHVIYPLNFDTLDSSENFLELKVNQQTKLQWQTKAVG